MNKSFKLNKNGAYDLYIDDKEIGVSFFIPDDYKIEDYAEKINYITKENINQYKEFYIRITSEPAKFTKADIYSDGGMDSTSNVIFNISQYIKLEKNNNYFIRSKEKLEPFFASAIIEENSAFTLTFNNHKDFEELTPVETDKITNALLIKKNVGTKLAIRDDVWGVCFKGNKRQLLFTEVEKEEANQIIFNSKDIAFFNSQFFFGDQDSSLCFSSGFAYGESADFEMRDGINLIYQAGAKSSEMRFDRSSVVFGKSRSLGKIDDLSEVDKGIDKIAHKIELNAQSLLFPYKQELRVYGNNKITKNDDWNVLLFAENSKLLMADSSIAFSKGTPVFMNNNSFINSKLSISFQDDFADGWTIDKSSEDYRLYLKNNHFYNSHIEGLSCKDMESWKVNNLTANNIKCGPYSFITQDKNIESKIDNLTLEERSSLYLFGFTIDRPNKNFSIFNCVVKGSANIRMGGINTFRNLIFEDSLISKFNGDIPLDIENSSLNSTILLENVKKIEFSIINNANIKGKDKEPIVISNELIDNSLGAEEERMKQKTINTEELDIL
jgi:hypothetical protein